MSALTFDTHPLYKKLVYAGMTKEQAEAQIEVMIDISNKMNQNKYVDQQNKSLWKDLIKTVFWSSLGGMLLACILTAEIVGLKHMHFT